MPQIQKGETFADGQQVTGARLNQLIDSATILPNIITDQTNIAVNGVASNDSLLVYDLSATALREANVSDVLGSNVPVTTSQITAGNTSDVTISPQNGTLVAGSAFTSADGLTVVVTSNAHGLVAGQVVTTTASTVAGYNGTHKITAVTTNTFTYVMTVAGTIGSGTISYTKQGVVKNTANEVISNNLYVDGNANITGALTTSSTLGVTGALTASSTLAVTGVTTLTGAANINGAVTASGTVNITGAIQFGGTVVYSMYEVTKHTATTTALTKPADEIWVINASDSKQNPTAMSCVIQATTTLTGITPPSFVLVFDVSFGEQNSQSSTYAFWSDVFIIPTATTFTSKTIAVTSAGTSVSVFTITKYKTA